MSIRPTQIRETAYSSMETPKTDYEIRGKQAKEYYISMLICAFIDYAVSSLVCVKESNFFDSNKTNDIIRFIISISCLSAFYLFIMISLCFYDLEFSKFVKYFYIIIVSLYFLFEFVSNIINFVKNYKLIDWMDMVFFLFVLFTLIPRLLFVCYIDSFIIIMVELDDCKAGEEHDKFKQKLEIKMERGEDTNWSKTSMPAEGRQQSKFLAGSNAHQTVTNFEMNDGTIKEHENDDSRNENENDSENNF